MRVIAGEWGGRRLAAPRGSRTRPTSDRVRESLFMMLEPLAGLRVVDLYAGSGALGIEALSRGAARADFAESDAAALRTLRANLASLGITDTAAVWPVTLPRGLARLAAALAAADLVLLDPPYGGEPARATLAAVGSPGVLREGARVIVEHHMKDILPERVGRLARTRERRHGETQVTVYRAERDAPAGEEGPR